MIFIHNVIVEHNNYLGKETVISVFVQVFPTGRSESQYTFLSDFHHVIRACDQISELVHCLKTHLSSHQVAPRVSQYLAPTLRNVIIGKDKPRGIYRCT